MQNKRSFERKEKKLKAEIYTKSGITLSSTVDLSEKGLFLTTVEPIEKGEEVLISLKISKAIKLEIHGIIRWCRTEEVDNKKSGMGVEFINIGSKDYEILNKIIKI